MRVKITLVRVVFTIVRVVITFVRVKIRLVVEITLCLYKSHSLVSYSIAYVSKLLSCEWKPHFACKITLSVWKSYSACRNQSFVCVEINLVRVEITIERVKITMRVEITLCVYKSHSYVSLSHS
jgi:hypothetical protein